MTGVTIRRNAIVIFMCIELMLTCEFIVSSVLKNALSCKSQH